MLETVLHGSLEIRSSIVSATYVIMLVFVPLLLLEGLEGRLLRPLAISYLVAIFASLVVAVTVTPVLCTFLLAARGRSGAARASRRSCACSARAYAPVLRGQHPPAVAGRGWATLLLVGGGVAALLGVGRSFLPEFNEGSLTINMVLAPGHLARRERRARDHGRARAARRPRRAQRRTPDRPRRARRARARRRDQRVRGAR